MKTASSQERGRAPQLFAESKAVVQLVLPYAWVTRINELAIARRVNRSALIREAIAATYFAETCQAERAAVTSTRTGLTVHGVHEVTVEGVKDDGTYRRATVDIASGE